MNLYYGKIVDVFQEDGLAMGRLRVGGVFKKVSLALVADASAGDVALVCDGVAIGTVNEKETNVSGDTGKSA